MDYDSALEIRLKAADFAFSLAAFCCDRPSYYSLRLPSGLRLCCERLPYPDGDTEEKLMEAKQYDVIIVGGGMGGLNPATLTYALDKEELWDDSGQCWV